jgi:zinc transport system substrate-binding protein
MILRLLLLLALLLAATPATARVAVSILPLQSWAQELTGEEVQVLVGPGQSPALFEPTGRQLAALADADIFFAIGVPFEKALLPRLQRMFPGMEIVRLGNGIERMAWPEVEGHGAHQHDDDPHVWLDPAHAASLIAEMEEALVRIAPAQAEAIRERSAAMQRRFRDLDLRLREQLRPLEGQTLLAYHPALGYYAAAYGLKQAAVESGGTEPGARHLTALASRLQHQSLRVLVIEPQFAPHRARSVAGSLGLEVIVFDPLATDLVSELELFSTELLRFVPGGSQP